MVISWIIGNHNRCESGNSAESVTSWLSVTVNRYGGKELWISGLGYLINMAI